MTFRASSASLPPSSGLQKNSLLLLAQFSLFPHPLYQPPIPGILCPSTPVGHTGLGCWWTIFIPLSVLHCTFPGPIPIPGEGQLQGTCPPSLPPFPGDSTKPCRKPSFPPFCGPSQSPVLIHPSVLVLARQNILTLQNLFSFKKH